MLTVVAEDGARHVDVSLLDDVVRESERQELVRLRRELAKISMGPVGQGGDEVSVGAFIGSQRTEHGVPHAVSYRALGCSESWFYKWRDRPPTARRVRRAELAEQIRAFFDASGGTYGSPRITQDLWAAGCPVSENTVTKLMASLGLAGPQALAAAQPDQAGQACSRAGLGRA